MGSRANAVIIEGGERRVCYSRWALRNYRHDYRGFYQDAPRFVEFSARPEDAYIEKIRRCVVDDPWRGCPGGMRLEEEERIFAGTIRKYRDDNPSPRSLPML